MIDEISKVTDTKDIASVQKALSSIHSQATGMVFSKDVPTDVPSGKILIYDNGAGTKRVYFKTGLNNIGYITLT